MFGIFYESNQTHHQTTLLSLLTDFSLCYSMSDPPPQDCGLSVTCQKSFGADGAHALWVWFGTVSHKLDFVWISSCHSVGTVWGQRERCRLTGCLVQQWKPQAQKIGTISLKRWQRNLHNRHYSLRCVCRSVSAVRQPHCSVLISSHLTHRQPEAGSTAESKSPWRARPFGQWPLKMFWTRWGQWQQKWKLISSALASPTSCGVQLTLICFDKVWPSAREGSGLLTCC